MEWVVNHPDWLGVAVAVLGFAVTIWQIRRSESATVGASRAADSAVELVRRNQFAAAALRLQTISGDIDSSVVGKEPSAAILRLLNGWREEAMRVAGLYGSESSGGDGAAAELAELHKALRDCADAIEKIVSGEVNMTTATQEARRSIKSAVEPIAILGASLGVSGQRKDEL